MDIVPLKVTMTKGASGIQYPPFNEISREIRRSLDWTQYVDLLGGWHYDRVSGFGESDAADAPGGGNPDPFTWCGVMLVEPAFAAEAVQKWPDKCSVLTEAAFEAFYDHRAHAHESPETVNTERINELRAKYGIMGRISLVELAKLPKKDLDDDDLEALNPEHPAPGIVRNKAKKWAWFKAARNLKIDQKAAAELIA